MNCRRIEEMIPLYVEGDLENDRAELVSDHLKSCAACGRLACGFSESQEWLHSYTPPAFDSTFFEGLRSGVRARIENEQSRPSFFQLIAARWRWNEALAAAGLLIVIGVLFFYAYYRAPGAAGDKTAVFEAPPREMTAPRETTETAIDESHREPEKRRQHKRRSLREAAAKVVEPAQPETLFGDPGVIENRTASEIESAAFSQVDPGQIESQPSEEPAATGEPMIRIEIQTSDPTIRIIWFAPNPADKNSGRRSTDT